MTQGVFKLAAWGLKLSAKSTNPTWEADVNSLISRVFIKRCSQRLQLLYKLVRLSTLKCLKASRRSHERRFLPTWYGVQRIPCLLLEYKIRTSEASFRISFRTSVCWTWWRKPRDWSGNGVLQAAPACASPQPFFAVLWDITVFEELFFGVNCSLRAKYSLWDHLLELTRDPPVNSVFK